MNWLFSQALVAAYLPESCSDGELSAPLSGSRTQLAYLPLDKMTAFLRLSRFGMTFKLLTADRGAELLMSYLAAFPARTSALQEKAQASPASAAECGDTWRGSLARFDPVASLWRTAQHSLLEDSQSSSVTWPRSGMTVDGQCWELPTLAHRTSATDSGLWPTPVASDIGSRNKPYAQGGTPLSLAVKWPTPNAEDHRAGMSNTPNRKQSSLPRTVAQELQTTQKHCGGLNPTWVEWLMGWPLGWTDLKPLEMDKSHFAPQPHGIY